MGPGELCGLVVVGFVGGGVEGVTFVKVGSVEPAVSGGVVGHGEEAILGLDAAFDGIDPYGDDRCHEFEQVDVCLAA